MNERDREPLKVEQGEALYIVSWGTEPGRLEERGRVARDRVRRQRNEPGMSYSKLAIFLLEKNKEKKNTQITNSKLPMNCLLL